MSDSAFAHVELVAKANFLGCVLSEEQPIDVKPPPICLHMALRDLLVYQMTTDHRGCLALGYPYLTNRSESR